jgi:hypothetical protein
MWVDAEVHLFPPEWCRPGYFPEGDETVMRAKIYDHPERAAALSQAHEEGLLAEMERAGIDRAVIMGLPWKSAARCWENNAYIADVVQRHPGKFAGMAVIPSPRSSNAEESVKRALGDYGLSGVKVVPSWQRYRLDDADFEPALQRLLDADAILMPHTDHGIVDPAQGDPVYGLYAVASRHPDLRILAPHLGGMLCLYELYGPAAPALQRVMYITTVPLSMPMVELACRVVGPQRLAFGTDFPFNPAHDQCSLKNAFADLALSEDAQASIAGRNVWRFLELQ